MADWSWSDFGTGLLSAGTSLLGGFLQRDATAANNAAMLSNSVQRDQFNAAQVAMQQANAWDWTQITNRQNRDFIWETNLQNQAFQRETNEWNAQQVAKQMAFQERLSGTAYQRAMADMRAAGLNPMLAYQQGGASSMPGAAPVGIAPKNIPPQYALTPMQAAYAGARAPQTEAATQLGAAVGGVATSAIDALGKLAGVEKTRAETENLGQDYQRKVHEVAKTEAEVKNIKEATVKLTSEINNNVLLSRILKAQGVTAEQAAQMGIIDLAAAAQFGGKYAPNAYEQVLRDVLEIVRKIAGHRPGDPVPAIPGVTAPSASRPRTFSEEPSPRQDPGHWMYRQTKEF